MSYKADIRLLKASNGWYMPGADEAANRVEKKVRSLRKKVKKLKKKRVVGKCNCTRPYGKVNRGGACKDCALVLTISSNESVTVLFQMPGIVTAFISTKS